MECINFKCSCDSCVTKWNTHSWIMNLIFMWLMQWHELAPPGMHKSRHCRWWFRRAGSAAKSRHYVWWFGRAEESPLPIDAVPISVFSMNTLEVQRRKNQCCNDTHHEAGSCGCSDAWRQHTSCCQAAWKAVNNNKCLSKSYGMNLNMACAACLPNRILHSANLQWQTTNLL